MRSLISQELTCFRKPSGLPQSGPAQAGRSSSRMKFSPALLMDPSRNTARKKTSSSSSSRCILFHSVFQTFQNQMPGALKCLENPTLDLDLHGCQGQGPPAPGSGVRTDPVCRSGGRRDVSDVCVKVNVVPRLTAVLTSSVCSGSLLVLSSRSINTNVLKADERNRTNRCTETFLGVRRLINPTACPASSRNQSEPVRTGSSPQGLRKRVKHRTNRQEERTASTRGR